MELSTLFSIKVDEEKSVHVPEQHKLWVMRYDYLMKIVQIVAYKM